MRDPKISVIGTRTKWNVSQLLLTPSINSNTLHTQTTQCSRAHRHVPLPQYVNSHFLPCSWLPRLSNLHY